MSEDDEERELPSVEDIVGSDPNRTGDLTTAQYIRWVRDDWETQLTPAEANQLFHDRAMRSVGLSGREFIRRWDADELDPDDAGVLEVAMLLPFGWAGTEGSG